MDNNQTTEDTGSTDSSIINELRRQLKGTTKELETFRNAKVESDRQALNEAGFGKLGPLYEKLMKEDPTLTPSEFLEDYGLTSTEPVVGEDPAPVEDTVTPDDVSGLSQQVAASATGGDNSREAAFDTALAKATSTTEIANVMAEFQAS